MTREKFDEYIRRFNAEDATAFDDYVAPDMIMLNGSLEFRGVAGMRDHYENKIWPHFVEKLTCYASSGTATLWPSSSGPVSRRGAMRT